MTAPTKLALSTARRQLVELMQDVNYGRIIDLHVRDREPVFSPPPVALRQFVFGGTNGPNRARANDRFALKNKVGELFEIFDREQTLWIKELVLEDGLPGRMTVAHEVSA